MHTRDDADGLLVVPRRWPTSSVLPILLVFVLAFAPSARAATTVDCEKGGDLQAAIDAASAGATLKVKGTCTGTFVIDKDLTLEGKGKGAATFDGNGAGPVVTVLPDATVALEKLTITGGAGTTVSPAAGVFIATGGIYSEGDLTLHKTKVTANSAEAMGEGAFVVAVGGVWNAGDGGLTLIKSEVRANTAISAGVGGVGAIGGIRNSTPDVVGAGALTLRKSRVSGNSATIDGAGVGPFPLIFSLGGLQSFGATAFEKSTMSGNTATCSGTGIVSCTGGMEVGTIPFSVTSNQVTFSKTTVAGNSAWASAATPFDLVYAQGGIINFGAAVTLTRSTVERNNAAAAGAGPAVAVGGIKTLSTGLSPPASLNLGESTVRRNSATADAGPAGFAVGGILNGDPIFPLPTVTTLSASAVTRNRAEAGAGTATGGLHDTLVPAGDGFILMDSRAKKNTPTNCNFVDPGCAT